MTIVTAMDFSDDGGDGDPKDFYVAECGCRLDGYFDGEPCEMHRRSLARVIAEETKTETEGSTP